MWLHYGQSSTCEKLEFNLFEYEAAAHGGSFPSECLWFISVQPHVQNVMYFGYPGTERCCERSLATSRKHRHLAQEVQVEEEEELTGYGGS